MAADTLEPKDQVRNHYQKVTRAKESLMVTNAQWIEEYKLYVYFNDGVQRLVDFAPYLSKHPSPYTNPYKDIRKFKRFRVDNGNLVWGKDWDMIFPTWKLHRGYLDV